MEEASDNEEAGFAYEAGEWDEPDADYEGDSLSEEGFTEEAADNEDASDQMEAGFVEEAEEWAEEDAAYEGDSLAEESFTHEGDSLAEESFIEEATDNEAGVAEEEGFTSEPTEWDEKGETTVDGVPVKYWITYYDASGNRVNDIPKMPGQYVAVVSFTSDNPDYCGDWIEPFAINKIPVEKPTPAALTFECGNWETGEGEEQDAFPKLDETLYEFVQDAEAGDGTKSLRSARAAGSYQACFRLKDPEIYEWAGESEDAEEVWIPWSIALQEFDANDPEVTYWGTAYNNTTTAIDYTGEPVWVRPWWTQAKDTDGRFPEWFTHWGSDIDRPTTDRLSSAVFYLEGDDDREGLVGYHTNADGSLEKVTAEQVYAWVCGVEIDGEHSPVESGDKVWYKTG